MIKLFSANLTRQNNVCKLLREQFCADFKLYRFERKEERIHNSSYPKNGVLCSKENF
jgi:hypothetical protein